MTALFLSPHNDDETLFGAYTIMAQPTHVVVVTQSKVQERYGITAETREQETRAALWELNLNNRQAKPRTVTYEQFPYPDDDEGSWPLIAGRLLGEHRHAEWDAVYAPALEPDGHVHHNNLGQLAVDVFGPERVTHYMTYTRHGGKSTSAFEVQPLEPEHVTRKLQALACYRSQIETVEAGCMAHFLRDLREYRQ